METKKAFEVKDIVIGETPNLEDGVQKIERIYLPIIVCSCPDCGSRFLWKKNDQKVLQEIYPHSPVD